MTPADADPLSRLLREMAALMADVPPVGQPTGPSRTDDADQGAAHPSEADDLPQALLQLLV